MGGGSKQLPDIQDGHPSKVGRIVAHLPILGHAPYAFPFFHRRLAQGFSQSTAVANHSVAWGFLLSKSGVGCISIRSIAFDYLGNTAIN